MINFKEHDGLLFKMLDKPVPLTADSNMPCLVRLIQDDSPMGRYNQSYSEYRYGVRLGCCMLPIIATHIAKNGVVNDIEWDVSRYEIIGYPVADGSKEWALHQMMQGEKVCHKKSPSIMYCKRDSKIMREVRCGCVDFMSIDAWLNGADNTGWQIYEEPKPEPQYKAGDFVEIINQYSGTKHLGQIDSIDHEIHIGTHRFNTNGNSAMETLPQLNIIRKLKPSEVIVEIGCLSGTVKDLSYVEDGIFWFISKETERCPGGMHCILYLEMLDTPTRKLVESLLKAQEEESQ